eukprot:1138713-Pelagomonas_calceolata.AAC.3
MMLSYQGNHALRNQQNPQADSTDRKGQVCRFHGLQVDERQGAIAHKVIPSYHICIPQLKRQGLYPMVT